MGINADASYNESTDILAKHHVDSRGDYYYLYNYNKMSEEAVNSTLVTDGTGYPFIDKEANFSEKSVTVTLQGEGRPY